MEKVIKGLEWILEDDRFGFGVNWENGEPRDDHEKAGKIITDAISLLKEQEVRIKKRDESLEKAWEEIKWLRGMLKEQEAIVRCMYCKRRGSYDCPVYTGGDGMYSEPDDWFCADGERKDT